MNPALDLIQKLQADGIRLEARGDRLHVDAPKGAVSAEVRLLLVSRKAELLDALAVSTVTTVTTDDSLDADQLAACQSMQADTADRHAGRVPAGDTARMLCARCGPVWIHPDIAEVLPVVDGWPRALGCPWCFVRKAGGHIPRPPVTCEGCQHFTPDTINPPAGMGTCSAGKGSHYPAQQHRCDTFDPARG